MEFAANQELCKQICFARSYRERDIYLLYRTKEVTYVGYAGKHVCYNLCACLLVYLYTDNHGFRREVFFHPHVRKYHVRQVQHVLVVEPFQRHTCPSLRPARRPPVGSGIWHGASRWAAGRYVRNLWDGSQSLGGKQIEGS